MDHASSGEVMGDFYTRSDGTYVPVGNGVDKIEPATFSEEVAEDPRLRAVPEVPGVDPRMQQVLAAPGLPPAGFGFVPPPAMQVMAPQFAFGNDAALNMQPMMQPFMQPFMGPSAFMPGCMSQPFDFSRGRQQYRGHQGNGRNRAPSSRARSKERDRQYKRRRANSQPPPARYDHSAPARDVRPVDKPRVEIPWQPTPKELIPTRRAEARQRAWEKPEGPLPYNRFPARDVRPAPVQRPDLPPRLQLSSDKEIAVEYARIRQKGIDEKRMRVEAKEAARREMKAAVAAHKEKQQPLRAVASGPGKDALPRGVPAAPATRISNNEVSSDDEPESEVPLKDRKRALNNAKKAAEEKRAAEGKRKAAKNASTKNHRVTCKELDRRLKMLEKRDIGLAGVFPKDERHDATARAFVSAPRSTVASEDEAEEVSPEELHAEMEEEGDEEPSDGVFSWQPRHRRGRCLR